MRGLIGLTLALCAAATGAACRHETPGEQGYFVDPARRARRSPEQWVQDLSREVERIRGLTFHTLPAVRVESVAAITAHLRDDLAAERDDLALEGRLGVALGVLPAGTDLVDTLSRFVGAEAQGYYDPDEGVLVLTTTEAEALSSAGAAGLEARATVIHELTHALQHQHFARRVEGASQRGPAFGDAARARLSLLEGDATVVTLEWTAQRRGGRLIGTDALTDRIARWAEGAQVLTEVDVPTYLVAAAEMPYEAGAVGVGAMLSAGGWARVNDALGREGLRAAEVLHPTRENIAWVTVPETPVALPGARALLSESLGEMELSLLLARVTRTERAAARATTWRGDRATLYATPQGDVLGWTVACADEAGAEAVVSELGPLVTRWQREGCPGLRGARDGRCPVQLSRDGATITLVRGNGV